MTTVMMHVWPDLDGCRWLVLGDEVLLEEELLIVACVAFALEIESIGDRAAVLHLLLS